MCIRDSHRAPMFITSWGCYEDPDLFLGRRFTEAGFGGVNRVWYSNPELDLMIAQGRENFEEEKRIPVYEKIQEFLAEEAPEADLFVSKTPVSYTHLDVYKRQIPA